MGNASGFLALLFMFVFSSVFLVFNLIVYVHDYIEKKEKIKKLNEWYSLHPECDNIGEKK